jgi:hypothetical protein
LFRYGKGIIDLNAKISDGAFDFGVAEQKLDGSQVTGAPVDQGRLGPSKRMGTEELRVKPDAGDPLGDKPCILGRRHALARTPSAGKQEFTGLLARSLYIIIDRLSGLIRQFEPDRLPVFLCRTVARSIAYPLGATSSTLSATTSQPRNLLSMARLNIAKSRVLPSTCNLVRIDQTCFGRRGGFAPVSLPLFQAVRLVVIEVAF